MGTYKLNIYEKLKEEEYILIEKYMHIIGFNELIEISIYNEVIKIQCLEKVLLHNNVFIISKGIKNIRGKDVTCVKAIKVN